MSRVLQGFRAYLALAAVGLLFVSPFIANTVSAAEIEKARLDAIAADMQARVDASKLSGAVIMIAKDGEIQMNQAFGNQIVEDSTPMSTDSIFRIFSMTKPVTGTALMMLYDEGKFRMSDPMEKYLPEFANLRVFTGENADGTLATEAAGHAMTIQELVSHTGGTYIRPPV